MAADETGVPSCKGLPGCGADASGASGAPDGATTSCVALVAVLGFMRVRSGREWLCLSAAAPGAVAIVLATTSGDKTSCRSLDSRSRLRIDSLALPAESLSVVSAGLAGGIGAPSANGALVESVAKGTCVAIGVSSRGGALKAPSAGVTLPAAGALAGALSGNAFAVPATSLVTVGAELASGTAGAPLADGASAQSPADGTSVAIGVSSDGETVETALGSGNWCQAGGAATGLPTVAVAKTRGAGWVIPPAAGELAGAPPSCGAFAVPAASSVSVGAGLASGAGGVPSVPEASVRFSAERTFVAIGVSSGGGETVATGSGSGNWEGRAAAREVTAEGANSGRNRRRAKHPKHRLGNHANSYRRACGRTCAALSSEAFALTSNGRLELQRRHPPNSCIALHERRGESRSTLATFSCLGACSWVGTAHNYCRAGQHERRSLQLPGSGTGVVSPLPIGLALGLGGIGQRWTLRHRRPHPSVWLSGVSLVPRSDGRIGSPPFGARAKIFGFQAEEVLPVASSAWPSSCA